MFLRNLIRQLFLAILVLYPVLFPKGASGGDLFKNSLSNKPAPYDEDGKRAITAVRTDIPLKIDGAFDDPAWRNTLFQGDFSQREPQEGAPSTERTEVGFLYDEKNLYIGIKCYDSEPGKIIAREMRRDAIVDDDDYFEFVLDTYHDHRTAYYFITNAHGSKREAKLANEGRDYNPAWDGVWACKAKITGEGWFVEIAIPWKTLKFEEKGSPSWGFNCARLIRRKNEHVYWQLIPRDYGQHVGIFRLSEAGSLLGISDVRMGGNLELMPYFLGGVENDLNTGFATERVTDIGLDAQIALTANLALDLTVNTDFAQVEADQELVNLTRFSLYYPEKREFFLKGAETFAFGGGGSGPWHQGESDMDLYYSRRIGLVDGREARILGGAKMVGKAGKYQIGLMNILTDDVTFQEGEGDVSSTVNGSNFTIVRFQRDILRRATIGLMFINKEVLRSPYYNRSVGVDGNIPLSLNFTMSGYLAATFGPEKTEDGQTIDRNKHNLAGKLSLDYNSDLWRASLSHQDIGARFNPEVGFIRRTDFRLSNASVEYAPRPVNSSVIRQFRYKLEGNYRSDHDNIMLDNALDATFSIEFQNSSRFSLDVKRQGEFLDYDWEVREGIIIPKGTYSGFLCSLNTQSDKGKPIAGTLNLNYGYYYGGHQTSLGLTGTITRIRRVRMELDYRHNDIRLPDGKFRTNTLGLRMFYFFSTDLYVKAYLQWNDDKHFNAGKERIVSDILLRWIYKPACNFYIVYNDARLVGPGSTEIINRTLMLKVTYFWRK